MKVAALLTGKGNNTLKDKNVLDILGHPVLFYPAQAAKKCALINSFYCSSDGMKVLNAARELGYQPIIRPAELALPQSQHIDCIMHALNIMHSNSDVPDILVVLLANNVTVKSTWITDCIEMMIKDMSISAVVPVFEQNEFHPLRAKKTNSDGTLAMYEDGVIGNISTNRQDLPKCYFLANNYWILNVKKLLSGEVGQPPWSFMGKRVFPYQIKEALDIHNMTDLYIAKEWVEHNYDDFN